ncbi:hypothetical protein NPIL_446581 [Nephila pilipes]|uniref:Uncharacterized protein n=1 Tax=Nephila pilipes TaxID=299642 RepID=A0A8X6TZH2_NEPPI|nr:hypothetical protein NPIL_446581 [Nephila pilipes]
MNESEYIRNANKVQELRFIVSKESDIKRSLSTGRKLADCESVSQVNGVTFTNLQLVRDCYVAFEQRKKSSNKSN